MGVDVRVVRGRRRSVALHDSFAHFVIELDRMRRAGRALDSGAVDEAFDAPTACDRKNLYSHWDERLDDELSKEQAPRTRWLLATIARDPNGASPDAIAALDPRGAAESLRVLQLLEAEGDVARDADHAATSPHPRPVRHGHLA